MKTITLTLNPAFDVHCSAETFAAERESIAVISQRIAAGKGINISRAMQKNGTDNVALAILGQDNAAEFRAQLQEDGITLCEIPVPGRIRENITLHVPGQKETRLSFVGFAADDALLAQVGEALGKLAEPGDLVTMTGRLAAGMSVAAVKQLLQELSERGVRIVIDSKSFSLGDMLACSPYLIKPNEEEISEYLGREVRSFAEVTEQAKVLYEKGIANVMVSLGEQGALLVCGEGVFTAVPPEITPVSTVGAGDSAIAGFLAAAGSGASAEDCLREAVAYGTAACLTEGTNPPEPADIARIRGRIRINRG